MRLAHHLAGLVPLVLGWGPPIAASESAEPGLRQVEVRLEADVLPAGPEQTLPLSVRVTNPDGSPAPGLEVRLDASAGSLTPAQDVGDGTYRSTFRSPASSHPQAILVAATAPGARPGLAMLRLRAKVDLPVRADKPRVKVTLLIGGRSYGPVQADDKGRVKIPIEVGPGETEAVASGLDEFGNQTRKPVRIPIPPAPRLAGFAQRARLCADGQDASDIYLMAIEPDGSPVKELKLTAVRPAGKLSPAERVAPGMVRLRFTAPERLTRPKVTLVLSLKGDEKLSRREFTFELGAGRPSRLSATAQPERLVSDGQATARLELRLADQTGNPLDGHALRIRCSPGSASAVQDLGLGVSRATYTAPLGLTGQAVCQAELVPEPAVKAELRIGLAAPAPARLEIEPSARSLPMDGRSQSRIVVRVFDARERGLTGVSVRISAPVGGLDQVSEDGQGQYHATYTAPRGEESTKIVLEVTAGVEGSAQVRERVALELEGVVAPPPPAPWVSLGPSAAYMSNFGLLHWAGASLQLDVKIPGLAELFYAGLEIGYRRGWWRGQAGPEDGPPARDAAVDVDLFPLHLLVLCKPLPHAVATPVLGLGVGAHFTRWALTAPDGAVERAQRTLLGSLAVLGVEIHLGHGALSLQARYLYSFLDDRASEIGSRVHGSTGGLDVNLGYRLEF